MVQTFFHSTFLKNICRFGNFITACMQKTQNKSGHSPSTRENILIFHQNPLQHPISALSASHVIIYCADYRIRVTDAERTEKMQKSICFESRFGGYEGLRGTCKERIKCRSRAYVTKKGQLTDFAV